MKDVELMPGRLAGFLGTCERGRKAAVERYELMTGGYSRVMAKADVRWDDGVAETLVLRGDPPPGEAMLVTDRDTEWVVLEALTALGCVRMPAARYYDATAEHLGTKCIVLDCAPGPSLHATLQDVGDPLVHRDALVDVLASVHAVDIDALPPALARPVSWDTYMTEQNAAWAAIERTLAESNPIMRYVGAWLEANRPPPMALTLCHGDFQASNLLVHPTDGLQVIDWEFAHVGDPREDLGWYVVYSQSSPPSTYAPDPEGFLARYRERTGTSGIEVNQATVGYFAVVSAAKVFAGILQSARTIYEGTGGGVMTMYNLNAAAIGHQNFLAACAGLAEPLAALRDAVAA